MIALLALPWTIVAVAVQVIVGDVFDNPTCQRQLAN